MAKRFHTSNVSKSDSAGWRLHIILCLHKNIKHLIIPTYRSFLQKPRSCKPYWSIIAHDRQRKPVSSSFDKCIIIHLDMVSFSIVNSDCVIRNFKIDKMTAKWRIPSPDKVCKRHLLPVCDDDGVPTFMLLPIGLMLIMRSSFYNSKRIIEMEIFR